MNPFDKTHIRATVFFVIGLVLCVLLGLFAIVAADAQEAHLLYLPIAAEEPELLPPITSEPVSNGDFEDGLTDWHKSHDRDGWAIVQDERAINGQWLAMLGGDAGDVDYISQLVDIPADRPILSFWSATLSEEDCDYPDRGTVVLSHPENGDSITMYTLDLCRGDGEWSRQLVDLSPFAGSTVHLELFVTTNGLHPSWWLVDGVELVAP